MRQKRKGCGLRTPQGLGVCSATGKQRYSHTGAEYQARFMRRKYHEVFQEYRCQDCDSWHVGGVFVDLSNSHV